MDGVGQNPRYHIEALLGEGGMGRVYRARPEGGGPSVAVKVLRRDPASSSYAPADRARFRQEAEAAGRVGHPGIIRVFDYQQLPDGEALIAMELLDGESLDVWLARSGAWSEGLRILAAVADALHCAHEHGIVHRDVKPQNVFLHGPPGARIPKILDFGIAKVTASEHTQIETVAGTVLGTPHYLAPERALGRPLDARADLYSLGVILYELLTGRVPFVAATAMEVLARHIREAPLDPRLAAPGSGIPEGLAQLTLALLAKNPADRPATGREVAAALERWAADPAVAGRVRPPSASHDPAAATLALDDLAARPTAVPGAGIAPDVPARSRGLRRSLGWLALGLTGVVAVALVGLFAREVPGPAVPDRSDAADVRAPATEPVAASTPEAPVEATDRPTPEVPVEATDRPTPASAVRHAEDRSASAPWVTPGEENATVAVGAAEAAQPSEGTEDRPKRPPRIKTRRNQRASSPNSPEPALPAFKDDVYAD